MSTEDTASQKATLNRIIAKLKEQDAPQTAHASADTTPTPAVVAIPETASADDARAILEQTSGHTESFLNEIDFDHAYGQMEFVQLPPLVAKEMTKTLYKKLLSQGQSYGGIQPQNYDFDTATSVPMEWGQIIVLKGKNEDANTQVSMFVDSEGEYVGYSPATVTGTNLDKAFKIFPSARSNHSATAIYRDSTLVDLATRNETISTMSIATAQLYNPAIETDVTPAPIFYRKLGFRSTGDVTGTNNAYLDKMKSGARLSSEELQALAREPVYLALPQQTRPDAVQRTKHAHPRQERQYDPIRDVGIQKSIEQVGKAWNSTPLSRQQLASALNHV